MILVIMGLMAEEWAFIRAEGNGSRAQVVGFILFMMICTSDWVVSSKRQRG